MSTTHSETMRNCLYWNVSPSGGRSFWDDTPKRLPDMFSAEESRVSRVQNWKYENFKIYDDPHQETEQLLSVTSFKDILNINFSRVVLWISCNLPIALILPDVLAWGARSPWRGSPDWGHQRGPELEVRKFQVHGGCIPRHRATSYKVIKEVSINFSRVVQQHRQPQVL